MKKFLILIITTLLISKISATNLDSLIKNKIDSSFQVQNVIDSKQNLEIEAIKKFEAVYEIKESLFSNQMTILTTIFSAIVAISIFIIGYLIPRLNENKYRVEIQRLLNEFESIRDEINKSREETKKLEAKNNFQNSRIMFFSCADSNNNIGKFLWALRHVEDHYKRFSNPEDKYVLFYIENAKYTLSEIIKEKHDLKEYVDEVNTLINEFKSSFKIEKLDELLDSIKEDFNKACWAENEKK